MKPFNFLSRQFSDLLVYLLLPVAALLVPASVSRGMARRMSAWNWLLEPEARENYQLASEYSAIEEAEAWMQRWRLTVILEARDLSLLSWGRRNSVFAEISGASGIEQSRDTVLIGMHWGPSIAILSLLEARGLKPLFVYRPVEPSIFRGRPWLYLFLTRSVRYIRKTCGERAITIKGAGAKLERELPQPGTSIILLDAPPAPGRSTMEGVVAGHRVKFNAGFPEILEASGRAYQFYAISLKAGPSALKQLEMTPARRPQSEQQLMGDYCAFLSDHISMDSAQWRIWQVADQFFQPAAAEDETLAPQE